MLEAVLGAFSGWEGYVLVLGIGVALGGAIAGPGAWHWQANRYERQLAERGRELAELREGQVREVAAAVDAARQDYQGKVERQTEITNDATKVAESARNDARAAGAVAEQLRQRVAQLGAAAHAAGGAAAVGAGQAAGDPLDVLADVLGRADKRAGELAAYADAARIAGQACERTYDSLTKK
ncbi:DUF2514 family protein [Cupriavidus sp. YAF13]|uniref:DUF2514 family protein n=1 Tax=Cupriavidus sp. YAF13 TaxID=3233075 RepID=UPI003F933211